jgi:signal transduction histidine kinase
LLTKPYDSAEVALFVRNLVEARFLHIRYILADRQRLKQVLLNLLSNAVKYNRAGGSVTLGYREVPGGMLRLMVQDSGFGIASGDTAKLFNPFERLRAIDSNIEGMGLGLAISRRFIQMMGGESVLDEGSTFWIELPLAWKI